MQKPEALTCSSRSLLHLNICLFITALLTKKKEAEKIWDSHLFEGQEKCKGTINKILPNRKAGFIKQDNSRETYYFNFSSVKARKQDIQEGTSVSFFLKNSFDKKKNKESKEAVEITF